jgi:hypothetical protein
MSDGRLTRNEGLDVHIEPLSQGEHATRRCTCSLGSGKRPNKPHDDYLLTRVQSRATPPQTPRPGASSGRREMHTATVRRFAWDHANAALNEAPTPRAKHRHPAALLVLRFSEPLLIRRAEQVVASLRRHPSKQPQPRPLAPTIRLATALPINTRRLRQGGDRSSEQRQPNEGDHDRFLDGPSVHRPRATHILAARTSSARSRTTLRSGFV